MPSFGSNRLHHSTLRSSPSTRFYCKIRTYTDLCTNLHCACSACWTLAKPRDRAESCSTGLPAIPPTCAALSRCTNSYGQQINILVHAIPFSPFPCRFGTAGTIGGEHGRSRYRKAEKSQQCGAGSPGAIRAHHEEPAWALPAIRRASETGPYIGLCCPATDLAPMPISNGSTLSPGTP